MAPIRRYLRITKNSVLEVRIYLDKPSEAPWLLSSRDPVLPRIIEEIRPKVLPKLREENEKAKKKGGKKKKGIKDVVSREDFEVVIFLKDSSSRHSLLTKQKILTDKARLKRTDNSLTGWLNDSENPITVEDDEAPATVWREEEEDDVVQLNDIPEANVGNKRKASNSEASNGDPLFVSSDDEPAFQTQRSPRSKQLKPATKRSELRGPRRTTDEMDEKKKPGINTSFDGFSIYGRTLCLVVKRKGKRASSSTSDVPLASNQMMEQWVSTQAAQDAGLNEDEDG